jgi:hypothetical protein
MIPVPNDQLVTQSSAGSPIRFLAAAAGGGRKKDDQEEARTEPQSDLYYSLQLSSEFLRRRPRVTCPLADCAAAEDSTIGTKSTRWSGAAMLALLLMNHSIE